MVKRGNMEKEVIVGNLKKTQIKDVIVICN